MTCNLLRKELCSPPIPTFYVFLFMGALVLVPGYPFGMVFFFGCLALFFTTQFARENHDVYYSAVLPLSKREAVRGRCMLFGVFQLAQLLVAVPFAVIRYCLIPGDNVVGIEANAAWCGFGLVIYAAFNLVFLTGYYKTAQKIGVPFLAALVPVLLLITVMEGVSHIPALAWIDSVRPDDQVRQLSILVAGVVIWLLGWVGTFRLACARFERADL